MTDIKEIGRRAKSASKEVSNASTDVKDGALRAIAKALIENTDHILSENEKDIAGAREKGINQAMLDRLTLTEKRITDISDGVIKLTMMQDPAGIIESEMTHPNGLRIYKTRVPMGVIAMIFEARPNVTVDAAALCLKSGNACILRGGSEAIHSNIALANTMRAALQSAGLPPDAIILVEDTSRETATGLMQLRGYVDLLIPRGGAGLIQSVMKNATVPVIETGVGNCHIYVDASANLAMAVNILDNAKTTRPSVCNAVETVLVHRDIAQSFLPLAKKALDAHHVELRGCPETLRILREAIPATEEDYYTEFNDYILAVRIVGSIDEAITHIAKYSTFHSEAIVTESYENSQRFIKEVDAAAVYVNASTRFTDGSEFGFGAEIGISTQKLHARGPMGLQELTTWKYVVMGEGQVR